MPWCPRCRTEYREGFTVCADCGEPLVPELPAEKKQDSQKPEDGKPVYLTTISDEQELEHFTQLLHASRIPFYTQDVETGEYMRIYMGFSLYGQQIYVRAQDAPLCMQLLAGLQGGCSEEETEAAYDEYMQHAAAEAPKEPEPEQAGGGYGVLKGFLLFFGLLALAGILKSIL